MPEQPPTHHADRSSTTEALRLLEIAWAYQTLGTLHAPGGTAFDELPAAA